MEHTLILHVSDYLLHYWELLCMISGVSDQSFVGFQMGQDLLFVRTASRGYLEGKDE